jgi:hypothetical protein
MKLEWWIVEKRGRRYSGGWTPICVEKPTNEADPNGVHVPWASMRLSLTEICEFVCF